MEVESLPLLRFQPALHLCALVGAVVVHDQMHFLVGRQFAFEMIQEFHKLPTAVALLAGTDDFAIQNVERGEQGGRAMPLVVVRLALRQARSQRQERSGAIQSLNLALFVHTPYSARSGGFMYSP